MKLLAVLLLYTLLVFQLSANSFELGEFEPKNFSRETYILKITAPSPKELSQLMAKVPVRKEDKVLQKLRIAIRVGDTLLYLVKGSLQRTGLRTISFEAHGNKHIDAGKHELIITDARKDTPILSSEVEIPERSLEKDRQPFIVKSEPSGGVSGSLVTVYGYNFGNSIDKSYIIFLDPKGDKDHTYGEKEITRDKPIYIGTTALEADKAGKVLDEMKFIIPRRIQTKLRNQFSFMEKYIWGKKLKLYFLINHRPTQETTITILPTNWKWVTASMSLGITLLFLISIGLITRKWFYFPEILIDKRQNVYNIAYFQSFLWTLTFIGSYFYISVAKLFLLKDGELPGFSFSLVTLMGISYGGLISSNMIEKKKFTNKLKTTPPKFRDVFYSEAGSIDIAKLQLFGFTIVVIIIYIANLFTSSSLSKLPEIPATLQTLLLGSQTGYLGSRYTEENTGIHFIQPQEFRIAQEGQSIQIIGGGFSSGMKLLLDGFDPVETEFINSKSLKAILPTIPEAGEYEGMLMPKEGQNIPFPEKLVFV